MRAIFPCLALLAATISTDAGARDRGDTRFYTRPGSAMPFSPAVRAGDLLFLSGQIGVAADGTVPPSIADQARLAMDHLKDSLTLAGASFDDVVKCTVMLADMSRWSDFNTVYVGYFRPGRLPARSAFGVTGLAFGAGVEVDCVARSPGQPG
ncbi:MAG: RidA family protein [Alphaproteobacteria bacterium]|nr:RidA family protein [Alphaproteobacteria bacterium]